MPEHTRTGTGSGVTLKLVFPEGTGGDTSKCCRLTHKTDQVIDSVDPEAFSFPHSSVDPA
jgi:hypothetical protein